MEWVPADRVIGDRGARMARAFLRSSEQVRARYLRCRGAWEPHLERTRRAIERGMRRCTRHHTAIILGGGMLHDVPLEALAFCFKRVVIVDVVHLWRSVLAGLKFPHVEQVCLDVSGFIPAEDGGVPSVGMPDGLLALGTADFVVSLNLMSQLAVVPRLDAGSQGLSDGIDEMSRCMVLNHLAVLNRLGRQITLVSDFEQWEVRPSGGGHLARDILYGVNAGPFEEEWDWKIAPIPEAAAEFHVIHRVGVRSWTSPMM